MIELRSCYSTVAVISSCRKVCVGALSTRGGFRHMWKRVNMQIRTWVLDGGVAWLCNGCLLWLSSFLITLTAWLVRTTTTDTDTCWPIRRPTAMLWYIINTAIFWQNLHNLSAPNPVILHVFLSFYRSLPVICFTWIWNQSHGLSFILVGPLFRECLLNHPILEISPIA